MTPRDASRIVDASPSVVIHIGWHKAASTYLQNRVFPSLPVMYRPLMPPVIPLQRLPRGVARPVALFHGEPMDGGQLREILDLPERSDARPLVISHEGLSGHPHGYDLVDSRTVLRNLKLAFPNAKVLAVVRNQFDYLLSLYAFRLAVRGQEHRSLSRFVREDLARGLADYLQYDLLLGDYREHFGADRVVALPMELLQRDPGRFLARLQDFVGARVESAPLPEPANESTRALAALQAWRAANLLFKLPLLAGAVLRGHGRVALDEHRNRELPYFSLRQRYYDFKRMVTRRINRKFTAARKIGHRDLPDREALADLFGQSNMRMASSGLVDWSPRDFGYPWPAADLPAADPHASDGLVHQRALPAGLDDQ